MEKKINKQKKKKKEKSLSHVWLFTTPWTVACQAPPSMGFSRQEYWSELPFPSPRDLPDPGIKLRSPTLQANSLPSELPGKPNKFSLNLNQMSKVHDLNFFEMMSWNFSGCENIIPDLHWCQLQKKKKKKQNRKPWAIIMLTIAREIKDKDELYCFMERYCFTNLNLKN